MGFHLKSWLLGRALWQLPWRQRGAVLEPSPWSPGITQDATLGREWRSGFALVLPRGQMVFHGTAQTYKSKHSRNAKGKIILDLESSEYVC